MQRVTQQARKITEAKKRKNTIHHAERALFEAIPSPSRDPSDTGILNISFNNCSFLFPSKVENVTYCVLPY